MPNNSSQNQPLWHSKPIESIIADLDTDPDEGLPTTELNQRRARYGLNILTQRQGDGPVKRFLLQFHQPLVYILLAACVVTLALNEWADTVVIFAVVVINALIGFVQEAKALQAISALSSNLRTTATVIRNGKRSTIAAEELVPGDVVVLQAGDKVSADMRLIKVRDLQIDESALTGESMPVEKASVTLDEDTGLGDRRNMAYSSTLITYGSGLGVVIASGDSTEMGKISTLIATTQTLDTPLTKRIKEFSRVLLYAIIALSAVTVLVGWLHGKPVLDAFMAAVALAVGAIPEGLPAAVTIILAIGVSRMAKRRAIIRNLPAVETLGSTTVICSDKTGTLTKNEMTVTTLWAGGQQLYVTGNGYNPEGEFQYNNRQYDNENPSSTKHGSDKPHNENPSNEKFDPQSHPAILETLRAGFLCNEAELHAPDTDNSQWRITGDPTEAALLVVAHKAKLADKTNDERLDTIPFQSEYQYMASLHRGDGQNYIYLKGSLESLLPKSNTMLDGHGQLIAIDREAIQHLAESMAAEGLRVLAFARKSIVTDNIDHDMVSNDLEFLGLQAMIDPPRPEVAIAVADCHRAGIDVKMITGDHALTAASIAKQLGIIDDAHIDAVVTGRQLTEAKTSDWPTLATERKVFARVTPENKLALVKTLQDQGEVVAMTGDGVNDAPALRRADIGIAMALSGTEVAREAADMMLTDDNFATVSAAVEEGRGVFDNLKKFIVWTLPTNGGEGLVILLAVLLGLSLPLLPVHILWVNMTTAIFLGLMLAFEPKEDGIMLRPPNRADAPIIDGELLWRIALVSSLLCLTAFGLYKLELLWGSTETEARTVAAAMFVVGEAFYLINCRSLQGSVFDVGFFSNPWIWVGIAIMGVLQLAFTYLPIMNEWFQTAPISFNAWLRIFACGLLISVTVGLEKKWRNRQLEQIPPKSITTEAQR